MLGDCEIAAKQKLRFACERMESNKETLFREKGIWINLREKSLQSTWASSTMIDCIFLHLTRFEDSKVEGPWVIGESPGTKVRSSMIFQNFVFRLSDPKVCVKVLLRPRKLTWNHGTWKLVVWKMCFLSNAGAILIFWGVNPIEFHTV